MKRTLIVPLPQLTDTQRGAITAAAKSQGFEALFFASNQEALPFVSDAEIIFGIGVELAQAAPRLRWLCAPFAGVEPYLAPGVFSSPHALLSNSSGAYGTTIAEHIIMMALEMLRRRPEYEEIIRNRGWQRDLHIRSLRGSRITLLGAGDIGRETALRLRAFSPASMTAVNRSGADHSGLFDQVVPVSRLSEVLPKTDLLIMSLPGTPETDGIMNRERLLLLHRDAFLINVGRGNALDQQVLALLLRQGHLSGAALDVFAREPLPADDPLWDCPRLLITPHVAGNMTLDYTVEKIVALFLEDFENYCAGRPLKRQIDRTKGY